MSKTPYEIRLDVLAMAQRMMDNEHEHNVQKFMLKAGDSRLPSSKFEEHYPKVYTPEDLVARASSLYSFVEDTSTRSLSAPTRNNYTKPKS